MTTSRIITVLAFTVHIPLMTFNISLYAGTRAPTPAPTVLRDPVVRLSAGANHTCRVADDSSVQCWGENGSGQLGDNTTDDRDSPRTVSGLTDAVAVAAGQQHTCALIANGTARCWGSNSSGQLGDNTTAERHIPVPVFGLNNAVAISAGMFHTCAVIANGTARCWGAGSSGQLGDGTREDRLIPVPVSMLVVPGLPTLPLTNAVAIAAGGSHTCALLADGAARCWGAGGSGALGDGTTEDRLIPVAVSMLLVTFGLPTVPLFNAVAIAAGQHHTCALLAGPVGLVVSTVYCWGEGGSGRLGNGQTIDRLIGNPVSGGITNATAIAAGGAHTCALLADGTARCWGEGSSGRLGNGTTTIDQFTPVAVTGLTGAVAIAAGAAHTCALANNEAKRCWGLNDSGQLGDGFTTSNIVANFSGARDIAAGDTHTCALRFNGTAACWGNNEHGQLGDDTITDRPAPVAVSDLTNAVAIAAGTAHTCALLAGGTARCWGEGSSGRLGDGTTTDRPKSVAVSDLTNAVAIAAGNAHTCALLATGTARCWGRNDSGQLGDGTFNNRPLPTAVTGLFNGVAIAAGNSHTCTLIADGTVRCWGSNSFRQLGGGDGTFNDQPLPTPVTGLTNAVAIAAGEEHTCALRANGTVQCWGEGASGQLGDGSRADQFVPLNSVSLIDNAVAIAAGDFHTCAILATGTARCWGSNSSGQLGDGTDVLRPTPVTVTSSDFQPGGLRGIVQLATGNNHTCARLANGGVRCWGSNADGQIGDGGRPSPDRLRPVAISEVHGTISGAMFHF